MSYCRFAAPRFLGLFCALCLCALAGRSLAQGVHVEMPVVVLTDIPFDVTVQLDAATPDSVLQMPVYVEVNGDARTAVRDGYTATARGLVSSSGGVEVVVSRGGSVLEQASTRAIPGWYSIIPPLLVIVIALISKQVIPSLFLGLWLGAWGALGLSGVGIWQGLLDAFEVFVQAAIKDPDDSGRVSIILFTFMIGGMVGIITKNGGMQGVISKIAAWASTPRKGQLATSIMGLVIFFDDYANTLVVGNTMRPVTDRLRISREKLAYIVDSTAAPVATIALVTTWIGFQIGLIGPAVAQLPDFNENAYAIFLQSIPYSFYPILAIFFVFIVSYMGRDMGPMYEAEVRARTTGDVFAPGASIDENAAEGGELKPKDHMPKRALNALIPILVLVGGVLVGIYITGEGETLRDIVGNADSYKALMWASLLGVFVAAALSVGQRILNVEEVIEAWYGGLKAMLFAMIILVLAWSLSDVTTVLHTADYLVSVLGEALPPGIVPALVFLLAAATSFATGSSWGTMGILMPLVVPLVWAVLQANGIADPSHYYLMYSTVACILAGSVWGDHCTPISDTTILSSLASGCDHIDHVRTQLPYAILVGGVGVLLGTIPTGFGLPAWVSILVGMATLTVVLRYFGKPVDQAV